jgi:spore germination cell wall hydrolase CwlJ-like protein
MKFLLLLVALLVALIQADCNNHDAVALTIYYEANLSDDNDMQGVANVIRNRIVHREFPNDAKAVVQQRGQFAVWFQGGNAKRDCDTGRRPSGSAWSRASGLAGQVLNGSIRDNTQTAQFFWQSRNPPSPRTRLTVQFGKHFYFTIFRMKKEQEKGNIVDSFNKISL